MTVFTEILQSLAELSEKADNLAIDPTEAEQIRARILKAADCGYFGRGAQDAFLSLCNMIAEDFRDSN